MQEELKIIRQNPEKALRDKGVKVFPLNKKQNIKTYRVTKYIEKYSIS